MKNNSRFIKIVLNSKKSYIIRCNRVKLEYVINDLVHNNYNYALVKNGVEIYTNSTFEFNLFKDLYTDMVYNIVIDRKRGI